MFKSLKSTACLASMFIGSSVAYTLTSEPCNAIDLSQSAQNKQTDLKSGYRGQPINQIGYYAK